MFQGKFLFSLQFEENTLWYKQRISILSWHGDNFNSALSSFIYRYFEILKLQFRFSCQLFFFRKFYIFNRNRVNEIFVILSTYPHRKYHKIFNSKVPKLVICTFLNYPLKLPSISNIVGSTDTIPWRFFLPKYKSKLLQTTKPLITWALRLCLRSHNCTW